MAFYEVEVQETYVKKIIVKSDDHEGAFDAANSANVSMSDEDYLNDSFQVLGVEKVDSSQVIPVIDDVSDKPSELLVEVVGESELAGLYKAFGFKSTTDVVSVIGEIEKTIDESGDDIDKDELLLERGIERFFVEQLCLD